MPKNHQTELINRGLDRFNQFLSDELNQVTYLAPQIPDQAFIFMGAYHDPELTQNEIEKATDLLVRMVLSSEVEAPLVIIFEYAPGKYEVINMADEQRKQQIQKWLTSLREESKQAIQREINLLPAV